MSEYPLTHNPKPLLGNDLHHWTQGLPERYLNLWPRRVVYTLSTLTDVPLVQSLVAGMVCIGLGRQRATRLESNP
jgi:hypothetical protein